MKSFLIGIVLSVLLSACSSTGTKAPVDSPLKTGSSSGTGPGSGMGPGNGMGVTDASRNITARPPTAIAAPDSGALGAAGAATQVGRSIYFDYNEFAVKPEYMDMLKQIFEQLKVRGSAPIRLEGNADERGSSEYNLALGQKRAEAVKKQLELLGASEAQLEAISFGSEKPRQTCHDEKCWAVNRRVDLMRQGK